MKTLIFIRHAKSDWSNLGLSDFERPLNERGRRDLPKMAQHFAEKKIKPELIISSPAERAKETSEMFAEHLNYDITNIRFEEEIYQFGKPFILQEIAKIENSINTLMFFGHNPDFSMLANTLSEDHIGSMPTCSIVCIDFESNDWSEVTKSKGKLRFFDYPKMFFNDITDD